MTTTRREEGIWIEKATTTAIVLSLHPIVGVVAAFVWWFKAATKGLVAAGRWRDKVVVAKRLLGLGF